MIYNVLNELVENEIKTFCFHLKVYTSSKYTPIPQSKLQSVARTDLASLLCQNYVKDAPRVTVDILRKMNKNTTASEIANL
uniref:Pyrin domain-containing protein n=1 Tax=Neogobius melanostomus TaxID=47308 RepID=A0A8C6SFY0_9GOBI